MLSSVKQYIPILMYHSISSCATTGFRSCTVPPEVLEEHLSYLEYAHYTSLTVTQFVQAIAQGGDGLPFRPIVLTFDDAYRDFYTSAFPALQRHGFTATLYVTTAFVGNSSRWLRYESERSRPIISWEQLAELRANGVECGAHTHTHKQLDTLPPSIARDEVAHSKEQLEEHLGEPVFSFAYPFGYYNARIRQIVQEAGFTSACAIKSKLSSLHDDPFSLARLAITPDTRINDLAAALLTGRGPLVVSPFKYVRGVVRQSIRRARARHGNPLADRFRKEVRVQ